MKHQIKETGKGKQQNRRAPTNNTRGQVGDTCADASEKKNPIQRPKLYVDTPFIVTDESGEESLDLLESFFRHGMSPLRRLLTKCDILRTEDEKSTRQKALSFSPSRQKKITLTAKKTLMKFIY